MVVFPWAAAEASPLVLIVATAVFEEDQDTQFVTSPVLVSLQCAVALNCCADPSGTVGFAGLMLMETIVAPVVALVGV